eukprot:3203385-Pyramimonas_sp.AAC.1
MVRRQRAPPITSRNCKAVRPVPRDQQKVDLSEILWRGDVRRHLSNVLACDLLVSWVVDMRLSHVQSESGA